MAEERATALWIVGRERAELRSVPLPAMGADGVLIETLFSGISRGSERLVFRGAVPASEHERMRCPFQDGRFPFPVKYGYAAVGRVVTGPPDLVGREVFALHPHQDRFVIPARDALPLPPQVPAGRAVLAANMETALNAAWDAGLGPGLRVAVVGAGVVGLLVAYLVSQMPGCELAVLDADRRKAAVCHRLRLPFATDVPAEGNFDVVVHASGCPAGLATALALAGPEALILELSWYGEGDVPAPLGGAFHSQRLTLRSSQVSQVAPAQRPRWTTRRRLAKALALLADPALDALISGETPFTALPDVIAGVLTGSEVVLCHRVRYQP